MAYRANDASDCLYLASSPDGDTWSGSQRLDFTSPKAPALAFFKGRLYLAWTANDASNRLYLASTDGATMSPAEGLPEAGEETPTLLSTPDRLYLAFKEKGDKNRLCIMSTSDGKQWSGAQRLAASSPRAPALAVLPALPPRDATAERQSTADPGATTAKAGGLLMVWCANDISNDLYGALFDGQEWSDPERYDMASPRAPALAWHDSALYLAWTGNDVSHRLYLARMK
jgi:hypothetical protein